jgi:hypothetical protein
MLWFAVTLVLVVYTNAFAPQTVHFIHHQRMRAIAPASVEDRARAEIEADAKVVGEDTMP